jgi:hypothetical protein
LLPGVCYCSELREWHPAIPPSHQPAPGRTRYTLPKSGNVAGIPALPKCFATLLAACCLLPGVCYCSELREYKQTNKQTAKKELLQNKVFCKNQA